MNPKMFQLITLTVLALSTSAIAISSISSAISVGSGGRLIDRDRTNHFNNFFLGQPMWNGYQHPSHQHTLHTEIQNILFQLRIKIEESDLKLTGKIEILETRVKVVEEYIKLLEKEHIKIMEILRLLPNKTCNQCPAKPTVTPDFISAIPRTCFDARQLNPALPSGFYWIDPDGEGIGEGPINVFCDMKSGSTFISHDSNVTDSESSNCYTPGCFSKPIIYNAPRNQIIALVQQSGKCQQSIKYDCLASPLESSGVVYSWWEDRNGKRQQFWSGNNANVPHTCQCGIDNNCKFADVRCNCDAGTYNQTFDEGLITVRDVLPVTKLRFGTENRFLLGVPKSIGRYHLGPLECNGEVIVDGMPTSCLDIWLLGHTLSGVYSVKGDKKVNAVFCDFSKPSNDPRFEVPLGYVDIKSASVYFQAQRNSGSESVNKPITYDVESTSPGKAMDISTGVFVAPRQGKYFFAFRGVKHAPDTQVAIVLNENIVTSSSGDAREPLGLFATLDLKKEDKVYARLLSGSLSKYGNHQFSGFIMEEDLMFRAVEAKKRLEAEN